MAQPTPDSLTLNPGALGSNLWGDTLGARWAQGCLVGYSTADGTANFVMLDAGLPVQPQTGASWVVTNAGTFAVQVSGDALTALQLLDDVVATIGSAVPAKGQAVAGTDGTNARLLKVDADGHPQVDVLSAALPTGAATEATLSTLNGKVTACNTGAVVVSSGTITAVSAVTAITNALPAGDNNIGNVDLVSLPAGNLGQQLAAASLSVAPASNIADATYIGDIKFGEALPAGTAAIGKLAANDAVDIGDVTVNNAVGSAVYVQPGTSAVFQVQSNSANVATESTLGDCKTALQIVDDWDSSDDCRSVQQSAAAMDGAARCTVKRFKLVTSTDGATLITAVSGKKFRIRSFSAIATSTTLTGLWLEDADGADVYADSTGIPLQIGSSGALGLVLNCNPDGWFETPTANKNLVVKLTSEQKVILIGTYIEVD